MATSTWQLAVAPSCSYCVHEWSLSLHPLKQRLPNSQCFSMGRTIPKIVCPFPWGMSTQSINAWFLGSSRVYPPIGISIGSAVLQCSRTWPTDRHTNTDRPRYSVRRNKPYLAIVVMRPNDSRCLFTVQFLSSYQSCIIFTAGLKLTCFTKLFAVSHLPDCFHGLLPGPFLLSYSVFICIFLIFSFSVPCARLSWPSRQIFSARIYRFVLESLPAYLLSKSF